MVLPKLEKGIYARKPEETNFLLTLLFDNLDVCSERVNDFARVKAYRKF